MKGTAGPTTRARRLPARGTETEEGTAKCLVRDAKPRSARSEFGHPPSDAPLHEPFAPGAAALPPARAQQWISPNDRLLARRKGRSGPAQKRPANPAGFVARCHTIARPDLFAAARTRAYESGTPPSHKHILLCPAAPPAARSDRLCANVQVRPPRHVDGRYRGPERRRRRPFCRSVMSPREV